LANTKLFALFSLVVAVGLLEILSFFHSFDIFFDSPVNKSFQKL